MMHDVFFSHNSDDKSEIKKIARLLKKRGITVWLDEWEIRPGTVWQTEIELALTQCRAAIIAIGANGLGPWEEPEMGALLRRNISIEKRENKIPIIPLFLKGNLEPLKIPVFLQAYSWVDAKSKGEKTLIDSLEWGITGSRPS